MKQIFVHSILSTDRTLEHCRPQDQAQLCGDVGGEGGIKYWSSHLLHLRIRLAVGSFSSKRFGPGLQSGLYYVCTVGIAILGKWWISERRGWRGHFLTNFFWISQEKNLFKWGVVWRKYKKNLPKSWNYLLFCFSALSNCRTLIYTYYFLRQKMLFPKNTLFYGF